jgi:hypothetical protein
MTYVLGVVNSTITPTLTSAQVDFFLLNPLIGIDITTNQVYAIESPITNPLLVSAVASPAIYREFQASVSSVTQCYQVVGMDANNLVSEPTTFCVRGKVESRNLFLH